MFFVFNTLLYQNPLNRADLLLFQELIFFTSFNGAVFLTSCRIKQNLTWISFFLILLAKKRENLKMRLLLLAERRQGSRSLCLDPWQEVFDIQAYPLSPVTEPDGGFFLLFSTIFIFWINAISEEKLNFKYGIFYLNRLSPQSHSQCAHSQQRFKEKQWQT